MSPASRAEAAGRRLVKVREQYEAALHESIAAAVEAVLDGMSEAEAARLVGVDRMTVRKALGKR